MAKPTNLRTPNDEDLKALAKKLVDTCGDIYSIGWNKGLDVTADTFDQLRTKEEIFLCELCANWRCVSMQSLSELCGDCEVCNNCL